MITFFDEKKNVRNCKIGRIHFWEIFLRVKKFEKFFFLGVEVGGGGQKSFFWAVSVLHILHYFHQKTFDIATVVNFGVVVVDRGVVIYFRKGERKNIVMLVTFFISISNVTTNKIVTFFERTHKWKMKLSIFLVNQSVL